MTGMKEKDSDENRHTRSSVTPTYVNNFHRGKTEDVELGQGGNYHGKGRMVAGLNIRANCRGPEKQSHILSEGGGGEGGKEGEKLGVNTANLF